MKKFTIGLILFAALSLSWIGLSMSDAQEVEPKQGMQDNALSSLLLIGKLRLGMNKKEVDEELARVGVAPLVLPQNDMFKSWIEVPNSDLTDVGIGFTKGKVTYFGGGGSGKVALTEKGKVDTLLADLYKAFGDPSAVYARKYSEEGVVFEWRSESKVIHVTIDPSDGNTLGVAVSKDAPKVNLMDLPPYSAEREQWAKALMKRTFGKTFSINHLPEKFVRPKEQLFTVFNPVSASGDKDYLAFFKSCEDAWGGDNSHRFTHLCALKKDSTVEILLADTLGGHDGDYVPLSYDPRSRRLLITDGTSPALLDFNSRSLIAIPDFYTNDAALDAEGNSMVMSSYSQGVSETERDIYGVDLSIVDGVTLKAPKKKAVVRLMGEELLPITSPDGKRLAFFHYQNLADGHLSYGPNDPMTGELYSLPSKGTITDTKALAPIAKGLRAANQLSWFPDNERVLIFYESGNADLWNTSYAPEVFNVSTKQRTALNFKPFVDPEMPTGRLSAPLDMSVSADGKQIIFRAFSWSGKTKDQAICHIYVCDLDGGQLKRITPNPPFKISKFRYGSAQITPENAWERSVDAFRKAQTPSLSKFP